MNRHFHQVEGRVTEVRPLDAFTQQARVSIPSGQVSCNLPNQCEVQPGDFMHLNSPIPLQQGQELQVQKFVTHAPQVIDLLVAFVRRRPARPTHAAICQPQD